MKWIRDGLILPVLCTSFLVAGCGNDSGPVDPPTGPTTLEVSPSRGSSGSVVSLEGLDLSGLKEADLRLLIHGVTANLRITPDGGLLASIPVFLTGTGALAPLPDSPVDFELFSGDRWIGRAESAFTVVAWPESPGAADRVVELLESITGDLEAVSLALAVEPGVEQAYAMAIPEAIRGLLTGEDEISVASQLAGLERGTDGSLEYVEGILAGSGLLTRLEEVAELMGGLGAQARSIRNTPTRKVTTLTQEDLAARMQLYVMVHDFGQQVIGQTASTWGMWVGTVVGGISLVGVGGTALAPGIAVGGTISLVLGLTNFALNNVALAYLPSRIDSFELQINQAVVAPGQVADTEIWIQASNQPVSITVLDLVDLVLNAMGRLPGQTPAGHPTRVALIQTIDYFLGILRNILSSYASIHPNVDLAYDAGSIPPMTWRARVTNTRYVVPLTLTPELIRPEGNAILAWRSVLDAEGEGRIYARIQSGAEVTSLPQIPGYEYNAGAFGEDIRATPTQSVIVAPPLEVTASMDPVISEGGLNGLEVRAGTRNSVGDMVWRAGLGVQLTATGGSVDPAQGVTGENGRFDSFVSLGAGSSSVTVDVVVTGDQGVQATTTVSANAAAGDLVVDARFVTTIEPDQIERLRIDVSRRTGTGEAEEPFANLVLTVTGGMATEYSGTTDDEGEWDTGISLTPGADEVVVRIQASAADGAEGEATVTARNLASMPLRVLSHVGRAWLNSNATGGPTWRLYRDNIRAPLASSVGVNWSYSSSGERDGGTCEVVTSLNYESRLIFDQQTGLLSRWESTADMTSQGTIGGSGAELNPGCGGNTQVQLTLAFRINEGSWRVSWNVQQRGETRDQHPTWESDGAFTDIDGVVWIAPPDHDVIGQMTLGPGDYRLFLNPRMEGDVSRFGAYEEYLATGGYTVGVDFEPVGGVANRR